MSLLTLHKSHSFCIYIYINTYIHIIVCVFLSKAGVLPDPIPPPLSEVSPGLGFVRLMKFEPRGKNNCICPVSDDGWLRLFGYCASNQHGVGSNPSDFNMRPLSLQSLLLCFLEKHMSLWIEASAINKV